MRESLFYFLNIWKLQRNVVHLQYKSKWQQYENK